RASVRTSRSSGLEKNSFQATPVTDKASVPPSIRCSPIGGAGQSAGRFASASGTGGSSVAHPPNARSAAGTRTGKRALFMRASFLSDEQPLDHEKEQRNEENSEEGSDEHPAKNPGSDRVLRPGARAGSDRKRHDAEAERERRHQNRPQAVAHRGQRRVKQPHAALQIQFSKLHDQ